MHGPFFIPTDFPKKSRGLGYEFKQTHGRERSLRLSLASSQFAVP